MYLLSVCLPVYFSSLQWLIRTHSRTFVSCEMWFLINWRMANTFDASPSPSIHSFSSISGVSCSIIWIYLVCLVRLCVCVYDSNRAQFAHTLVWLQALQINLKSQNKKNTRAFFLFMLLLQRSQRWKKRNIPTITTQRKCKLTNHKISDFFRLRNDTHTHTLSLSHRSTWKNAWR